MKYCPSCGKAGVERVKFCPQCGQRLMTSSLEDAQRAIPKPEPTPMKGSTVKTAQHGLEPLQAYSPMSEVPLKERTWFERHLNWTMVLTWAGSYLVVLIGTILALMADPYMSGDVLVVICIVIPVGASIAVGQWVLRKKNRSMWWLLLCAGFLFLFIDNKSPKQDADNRTMADYDKAIELAPDSADAYYNRGDAYDEMGEYGKAIADYSKVIGLAPNHASAYYDRGCAYGELGAYDKAIADYTKAIELNPNDSWAYYNRGLAYSRRGEAPKALYDLEKCIELSTDAELTEDAIRALHEVKESS